MSKCVTQSPLLRKHLHSPDTLRPTFYFDLYLLCASGEFRPYGWAPARISCTMMFPRQYPRYRLNHRPRSKEHLRLCRIVIMKPMTPDSMEPMIAAQEGWEEEIEQRQSRSEGSLENNRWRSSAERCRLKPLQDLFFWYF
jgi:hypothetical protein